MGAALGYPLHVLIALLWHDVMEDGPKEVRSQTGLLQKATGYGINRNLATQAIEIVADLTHGQESKEDYLQRIEDRGSDFSVLGKVLDRIDNLREGRASMSSSWLDKYLIGAKSIADMAERRGFSDRPEVQWLKNQIKTAKASIAPTASIKRG